MPEPAEYDPVLSGAAAAFLVALPRSRQKLVITLAFRLAKTPQPPGDYSSTDDSRRPLQNILLDDWHFTYWPDHAARELRITDITEV